MTRTPPHPLGLDHDRLWDGSAHDPLAAFRAALRHPRAREASDAFLDTLTRDAHVVASAAGKDL
ncbi:hypothetical protein [Actinomyces faecalis]|uniref:hypothetical protein n=1 Tax=Actinomyces faecalis TaxID=2722820 RepID=UPI001557696A|nr:hypothetical protein [Actinomyces faecalis]